MQQVVKANTDIGLKVVTCVRNHTENEVKIATMVLQDQLQKQGARETQAAPPPRRGRSARVARDENQPPPSPPQQRPWRP